MTRETRRAAPPPPVSLSVAIQTHPARPELAGRLLRELRDVRAENKRITTLVEVVSDPDPSGPRNPWRTARLCWERTPPDCTHRLVLQDDVIPCRRFLFHARLALAAKPDRITTFYLGQYPVTTYRDMLIASMRCAAWVRGSPASFVPALALAIPAPLVASLAEFHDGTEPIADDEVYGRWCRAEGYPWFATIPSLVNHDDDAPSLMRDPYARGSRTASCWIGNTDPHLIDWTRD